MAWKNYKSNSRGKKRSRRSPQEKFAFRLGQVNRGLKNPDSRISESFANGQKPKDKKQKKSLY